MIKKLSIKESVDYDRVYVPSEEAIQCMKKDPELKQYWKTLDEETIGEILIDKETKDQIGHAFVYKSGDSKGFIFNVEVNPKYRRMGFGKVLLDDAISKFGGIDLTVGVDNKVAVNMYLKRGFEIIDEVEVDGEKQYWMKLVKNESFTKLRESNQIVVDIPKQEYDFHFKGVDSDGWKRDVNRVQVKYGHRGQFVELVLINDEGVKLCSARKKFKLVGNDIIITDYDKNDVVIGNIVEE